MVEAPTASAAQGALVRELERVARLHAERVQNPILAGALTRVAHWQSRRLRMTYGDLAADPRHRNAIEFFQNDLYGTADFSRRDADLLRVVPVMVRMLPPAVVQTVALAIELNALSQELDRALLSRLSRADGHVSVEDYCRAYRRAGNISLRRRQIGLIVEVGGALDRYVGKPLIRAALVMMRQPARMAGLGALHDFLERGFAAFHRMRGAATFLEAVQTRETDILEAIVGGANDPFPDPLAFRLSEPAATRS